LFKEDKDSTFSTPIGSGPIFQTLEEAWKEDTGGLFSTRKKPEMTVRLNRHIEKDVLKADILKMKIFVKHSASRDGACNFTTRNTSLLPKNHPTAE